MIDIKVTNKFLDHKMLLLKRIYTNYFVYVPVCNKTMILLIDVKINWCHSSVSLYY